ncbi:MAG: ABC transporter ATP-binding protein [Thalassobaculales bacterium]
MPVVDGVSFRVAPGETLAIVGESGCGKTMTALAVMGLLPVAARRTAGRVALEGTELTGLDAEALRRLRGDRLAMIFQEPVASLNPLLTVGEQLTETLKAHRDIDERSARAEALRMLAAVGIPEPAMRLTQYPFELSGGMCQRVMIATALICGPRLLIADEPTTALDVTIQAQILALLKRLRDDTGAAVLLITHDMGVVAELADRLVVMYAGRVAEAGRTADVFAAPAHPYTRRLLSAIPRLDGPRKTRLATIDGVVPDSRDWPAGCRFRPRCPLAADACAEPPPLADLGGGRSAACWRSDAVGTLA